MIKTYDINHEILFEKTTSENKLFFIKNKKKIFSDAHMTKKFLESYQLTHEAFLSLPDENALKAHMLKIEQKYGCNPGYIHQMGILHLNQQKTKNFERLEPVLPSAKQAFIQKSQEWVQDPNAGHLPILEHAKTLLKTPMFKNNVLSELDNTLLVLTQQGYSSVEPLVRSLVELGFKASNIILFTKPHTTSHNNQEKFKALQSELGIHYICPPTNEECNNHESINASHPNVIYEQIKNAALNKAINEIKLQLNRDEIKNVIIHDEGGIFSKSEQFKTECISPFAENKSFSMSEHTMSGVESSEKLKVHFPCFSMAQSWLKTKVESFFVAEKSYLLAKKEIEEFLENHDEVTVSIVGLGNIGSQFSKMMIENAKKYLIHHPEKRIKFFVNDINPEALQSFLSNDFSPIEVRQENRHNMFSKSNFLIGSTGKDISINLENERFNTPHQISLMSISSGNREFESLLKNSFTNANFPGELNKRISNLNIVMKNEGRPIIFKDGVDDAIHPSKIQLIRAMTLSTIFQQLNYLAQKNLILSSNSKENKNILMAQEQIVNRFIDIDAYLQQELWEAFKIFQNEVPENLMCDDEQLKLPADLLSKDGSSESIMKHISHLRRDLKIDNSIPHSGNFICEYDKNHDLHIIEVEEQLRFVFLKNHKKVVYDPHMDSKKLREKGVNLDNFYQLNSIKKSEVIKDHYRLFKTQTLNQTPEDRTSHYSLKSRV